MKTISKSLVDRFIADGFLRIPLGAAARESVAATFQNAYPFFRAPAEEKLPNKMPEDGGYRPFGIEYSQSADSPDQIESFTASDRTRTATDDLPIARARILHQHMLGTFDALTSIAETLTICLAEAITGRAYGEKLHGAFRRWSRLQLNYARPAKTATAFINDVHEDGVLMTLVCATTPGFEVQLPSGDFVSLTTSPGEVLAMAGEITWLLSGGLIRPVYHCVRPVEGCQERLSQIFLGDIHPKYCEPWVLNEINAGVDIGARVLASADRFGITAFTVE